MKRSTSILLLLVVVVATASACAIKQSKYLNYADDPGAKLEPPPADKAMVVFLRPSKYAYKVSAVVFDGDDFVSVIMSRSYLTYLTEPGQHMFMVISEAADFLEADLEGGKIYFALVAARMGAWRARFSLVPVTPESKDWPQLRPWLDESYEVQANELAETWDRDNRDSVMAKKEAYLPRWQAKPVKPIMRKEDGVISF